MANQRRRSTIAVALSATSVAMFATVASVPESPFQPVLPAGIEPTGPFRWLAGVLGVDALHGAVLAAVGVVTAALAAAAFLFLLREAWRGNVSVRTVLVLGVAYHVVVMVLPLLFSRDVYSYIAYGRIAGLYHANPYVVTPADVPSDPILALVGYKWVNTPAVYGPLFTGASGVLAAHVRSIGALISVYRVVAIGSSLATLSLTWWLAHRLRPERTAFAAAAFGMNPVVLFNSVGSGHNDLLVALAVVGAFALVVARRELVAVGVLSLGTLVKASAGLPLVLLIVWIVASRPRRERLRAAAVSLGLAAAIAAAAAAPFFTRADPTLGLAELSGHEGWLAPSRFVHRVLDAISFHTLGGLGRVAFAITFLVCVVALARDTARVAQRADLATPDRLGARWAWSLLLLAMLGPVLLPWYVTWSLPLIWLLPKVPRGVLLAASTALAVSQWAAEPTRFSATYSVNVVIGYYVVTPVLVGGLVLLLLDLRRRLRSGAPLEGEANEVPTAAG